MPENSKISVVIPVLNGSSYIEETLNSIVHQKYHSFEVIVMDGGSNDGTIEIIKSFPQVKLFSQADKGQSDAINKGFARATGDILAWQNADDLYLDDTFEIVATYFDQHSDVGLIYGDYEFIDKDGKWICNVKTRSWNKWLFGHGRFCPVQPCVFWRKRVFDELGELNVNLNFCMDVDFYSRAAQQFAIKKVPYKLGKFRVHAMSKTQDLRNRKGHKDEYLRVLSRHFTYGSFDKIIFEFFYQRSRFASYLKKNWIRR